MIWDKSNGLVWMRCSLGQTWSGKTCSGDPQTNINFYQAKGEASRLNERGGYGGHKDWSVPTIRQLASLITCSTGSPNKYSLNVNDGGKEIVHGCPKGAEYLGFDPLAFPRTGFTNTWSSSECTLSFQGKYSRENCSSSPIGFAVDIAGEIIAMHRDSHQNQSVRLVRLAKLSGPQAAGTFAVAVPQANAGAWSSGRGENRAMEVADNERQSKGYARQQQSNPSPNQAENNALANRWSYHNHQYCATSGEITTCQVTCSNGQGATKGYSTSAFRGKYGNYWSGPKTSSQLGSMVAVFQDFCSKL